MENGGKGTGKRKKWEEKIREGEGKGRGGVSILDVGMEWRRALTTMSCAGMWIGILWIYFLSRELTMSRTIKMKIQITEVTIAAPLN